MTTRKSPTQPLTELARGFRKRTWVTAKLATKIGMRAAARQLRGRDAQEKTTVDVEASKAAAQELVDKLGQLKGLVMKVGQMASYLPGALPDQAQAVLAKLQAQSTAMEFDRVREVIESELGAPVSELFDDFEEVPFAAASIGQVHRARFSGKPIAVKVQYPGIEDVLASDISTVGLIAKMSTLGFAMDGGALVEELESRILEECDYELEARNQRELGAILCEDSRASVPAVVPERSSRRVLTTELVDAMRFEEFIAVAPQSAKDRAGDVIFDACFRSLFCHGAYNGDPHPGNYLFTEGGDVTFLDFGCVRRFEPEFIERWKAYARCVIDDDRGAFDERLRALGFVGTEKGFDYDYQWRITQYLYVPFMEKDPFFTYTDEYVRQSYSLMLFDNPNQRKTAMEPEWLLLNRLQWGLNSVLSKLGATSNWPAHFRAAVESAPIGSRDLSAHTPAQSAREASL